MSTKGKSARAGMAVVLGLSAAVSLGSAAKAGGLLGDFIENACGHCGAGHQLDETNRQLKNDIPPYKAVDEGVTSATRSNLRILLQH